MSSPKTAVAKPARRAKPAVAERNRALAISMTSVLLTLPRCLSGSDWSPASVCAA